MTHCLPRDKACLVSLVYMETLVERERDRESITNTAGEREQERESITNTAGERGLQTLVERERERALETLVERERALQSLVRKK